MSYAGRIAPTPGGMNRGYTMNARLSPQPIARWIGILLLVSLVLGAFAPEQRNALAILVIRLYGSSGSIPTLFYAVAWILLGRVIFVSGYLPCWLGILMAFAGGSATLGMFVNIAARALATDYFLLPMILGMLVFALWMLVRGVDADRWRERTTPHPV